MSTNEELVQRCFDMDLSDDEMKKLFFDLSKDGELRKTFRSMQSLQHDLHNISQPIVPSQLDRKVESLIFSTPAHSSSYNLKLHHLRTKRWSVSLPAIAASILLMLAASYVTATTIFTPAPETEYVYVVEMEPIIIRSNYLQ